ncbi:MAG TPA: translation elongation factor Ts [Planctomycetota bacterium]|jgi:elongation factor Ts|nr:translation elongation factor Ts [Planctomycetota bacterium]OQC22212.1 MAG: Elongation factor Ts [Planctomycetes bacterium ADurb.Bin069]NMD35406.1 translation elongation factor Ts [Planctomycetota bacterium]HNS00056.1 translation elongation factor Ts [Planctomycetota bacterium]HNU25395.1 translation elongation factor Ts [Planctomycetota bacterium]
MAVDAKVVKELRELTGLPMMVCKKALQDSGGDVEAAREILRKQGQKVAEAKVDRATKEGRIAGFVSPAGTRGIMVPLFCETEPVARCEDFVALHEAIIARLKGMAAPPRTNDELLATPLGSGKTVRDALFEVVAKIRENIQIGPLAVVEGDAVFQYIHFDGRHGALVALKGADPADAAIQAVGKDLCMHVVFAKPRYLARKDVAPDIVAKEREILLAAAQTDPKFAQKPAEIQQKVVEGKLGQFYAERCFLEQPYIRDDKIKVQAFVARDGKGAQIAAYAYAGVRP